MKAEKQFTLGRTNLNVFLWVLNVLDRDNVVDVYESSGLPDRVGWLESGAGQEFAEAKSEPDDAAVLPGRTEPLNGTEKYKLRQVDPMNYDTPRQIRIGARWTF
jgi:hypothetical protein